MVMRWPHGQGSSRTPRPWHLPGAGDERDMPGIAGRMAAADDRVPERGRIDMQPLLRVGPRPDEKTLRLPAFGTMGFDQVAQQLRNGRPRVARAAVHAPRPGRLHPVPASTARLAGPPALAVLALPLGVGAARRLPGHGAAAGRASKYSQLRSALCVSKRRALHQPRAASKLTQTAHVPDGT